MSPKYVVVALGFVVLACSSENGSVEEPEIRSASESLSTMSQADLIARAKPAVGYSYWWAHGAWRTDGTQHGSCNGSGCPNDCSHSGSYGADCSGFVAKVWQVPNDIDVTKDAHPYSTYNFKYESTHWGTVNRSDAAMGDAFVYHSNGAGHIFLYESKDPWGSMWAYECKGCNEGCVHNLRTAGSAYSVIRRDAIGPSAPADRPSSQGNVAAWGSGRLDVFVRGEDDALYHQYWQGNWGELEPLGGQISSNPVVVAWAANRLDIFARNADHTLGHIAWTGTNWTPWESLGGDLTSDPAVASWGPNRLDIFARGSDDTLEHIYWNGAWGPWESLGGELTSRPAVVAWGPNRLDIFARGSDQGLAHIAWTGTNWGAWDALGGTLTSAPAVAAWGPNRLDIFARGTDNSLQHIWWSNAWGPWESLGGELTSNPSVISWGPNRLDIFARGNDQGLAHIAWTGTQWGAWDALGGELTSDPAVVAWAPDRLDMFARGADATLQHDYWTGTAWGTLETHDAQIACEGDPAGIIDFCPPPPPTSAGGTGGTTGSGGAGNVGGAGWSGTGGALSPKTDPTRADSSDQGGCNLSANRRPLGYLIVFLVGACLLVVRRRPRWSRGPALWVCYKARCRRAHCLHRVRRNGRPLFTVL